MASGRGEGVWLTTCCYCEGVEANDSVSEEEHLTTVQVARKR